MKPSRMISVALGLAMTSPATWSAAQTTDEAAFRGLYRQLIEINTTLSAGSCTAAARAMASRLKSAGLPDNDMHVIVPPDLPAQGNLAAILRGSDANAEAILLLAHLDVVEANRADWQRDPFTLVEENGYFYGRGTADDKAMAAIFVDALARFKQTGYQPARSIKLALTCGEETPFDFNGVEYLPGADSPDARAGGGRCGR